MQMGYAIQDFGPSPRVWGEHGDPDLNSRCLRTIPTRVGRTTRCTGIAAVKADHPHACGENWVGDSEGSRTNGPSPRVWGELRGSLLMG